MPPGVRRPRLLTRQCTARAVRVRGRRLHLRGRERGDAARGGQVYIEKLLFSFFSHSIFPILEVYNFIFIYFNKTAF